MFKITKLKTWLTACCFLLVIVSQAQTTNPYWIVPPNYIQNSVSGIVRPNPLTTNTYTWIQSGYTVNPGYGGNGSTTLYDLDGYTVLNGPNNMYTDASGNPLFSIMSGYMFNAHGYLIDTLVDTLSLTGPFGSGSYGPLPVIIQGYAEVCVVPNPANCQQYYVFTALPATEYTQNNGGFDTPNGGPVYNVNTCYNSAAFHTTRAWVKPYFTTIDISQKGPYMPIGEFGKSLRTGATGKATAGDLFTTTSTQGVSGSACPSAPFKSDIHYAATTLINKSGATPYRLLFVLTTDELITYKITGTGTYGIQWLNTQAIGTLSGSKAGEYINVMSNVTELEIYQDHANNNIKVAFGAPQQSGTSGNNTLVLAKYDTSGVYVSGLTSATYTNTTGPFFISGVEFSPNGSYVYVTHTKNSSYPNTLERITFSSPVPNTYSLSTATSYQYSQIETGADGYLYLLDSSGTSPIISKISSPNSSSSVATTSVSLSGYPLAYVGGVQNDPPTYFLPDQIDQDVYGAQFNSPASCCLFYEPYDKTIYDVGTSPPTTTWTMTATTQTWSANTGTTTATCHNPIALQTNTTSTITIGQELRIPAGYTITINNMTIQFSPQARLIIENAWNSKNGGKLILSGCTLTVDNRCGLNDMWPGVQVWGNPSSSQTGANQGWLVTQSNTVIENAYVGVLAGYNNAWYSTVTPAPPLSATTTFSTSIDSGQGGAIIQSDNSTFLNNQRQAVFLDYSGAGSSSKHFNLCTFSINAALLTSGVKPKALVAFYNYTPSTYVFPINGCSFKDTYNNYTLTGLWSSNSAYWLDWYNSGSSYTRSTFGAFLYGIYSKNTVGNSATIQANHSTLTNNKVGIYLGNITNATVANDTTKIYNFASGNVSGLYLDNCTGYKVENNNYTKGTGTSGSNRYGILVYNSGANINCIYNNTFDNLYKGSQAQYINYVNTSTVTPVNGHGGLVYLCNTFKSGTISNADIYVPASNAGTNVGGTYSCSTCYAGINYSQGTGQPLPLGYPTTGGNHFSHTGSGAWDFYIDTLSYALLSTYYYYCPSGYCFTSSLAPAKHKNLTPAPVSDSIDCSSDPYSNGLRTTNPYAKMLNGAAAYKLIYDSLNTAINSLPANSPRSFDLVVKSGNVLNSRHRLIDEAIHYLINDGSDTSMLRVHALMREKALELPPRSRLETALAIHDSALAVSALTEVANQEGQSNYVALHTILLQNLSKTPEQIMKNSAIVSQLQAMIKDSSDHTAYLKAHILLSTIGLSNYQLYYQDSNHNNNVNDDGSRHANNNPSEDIVVSSASTLINQPNPFNESTTVKAVIVEKTQNAFIVITDMVGKEIARYPVQQGENNINVNADGLNQAVMFCTLVVDGVKIKTNKMVLIK